MDATEPRWLELADGCRLAVDDRGYLLDPADWNEALATELARRDGIELGAEHWQVIHLLRSYHQCHGRSPAMRLLVKEAAQALGTGVAGQGAPTTRWLSAASTGGPLAGLLNTPARLRAGWRGARRTERDQAATALGEETRAALASLASDAAADAETALRHAWSEAGRGAAPPEEGADDGRDHHEQTGGVRGGRLSRGGVG